MVMTFDAPKFLAELSGAGQRQWTCPEELPEAWRYDYEERAGIMEFCGELSRRQAEAEAWAEILSAIEKKPQLGT